MDFIIFIISSVGSVVVSSVIPPLEDMAIIILNSAIKTLTRELNIAILDTFLSMNYIDLFKDLFINPINIQYSADCLNTVEKDEINKKIIEHKHIIDMKLGISNPVYFFAGVAIASAVVVFGSSQYVNDTISHIVNHHILGWRK